MTSQTMTVKDWDIKILLTKTTWNLITRKVMWIWASCKHIGQWWGQSMEIKLLIEAYFINLCIICIIPCSAFIYMDLFILEQITDVKMGMLWVFNNSFAVKRPYSQWLVNSKIINNVKRLIRLLLQFCWQ